jgi:hypothetical protein
MPVSNKAFDETPSDVNPKILELFIKHPNSTYSLTELSKKFGNNVIVELIVLFMNKKITPLFKDGNSYYRLRK